MPRPRGRLGRILAAAALLLIVAAGAAGVLLFIEARRTLPLIEGTAPLPGLSAPAAAGRDERGIPAIRAESLDDALRVLGFVHAQDRFFQMDLIRRSAAGTLAELFGPAAVPADVRMRRHRFVDRALERLAALDPRELAALDAYAEGVNAGLASFGGPPWEYRLVRASPEPWRAVDSALVVYALFLEQHPDPEGRHERARGLLHEALPERLAEFLDPAGTEWDAAFDGEIPLEEPLPGPETVDLRQRPPAETAFDARQDVILGSNSWAIAGDRTRDGQSLLANDVHVGLREPNLFYWTELSWKDGSRERHAVGATIPGVPALILGSNGLVAWGLTNAYADWSDVVKLEPAGERAYGVPGGSEDFVANDVEVPVRGGSPTAAKTLETRWGPILGDGPDAAWTLHSTMYEPDAINLGYLSLLEAETLEVALDIAARSGIPPMNFTAVDSDGRIGWTIAGRLPLREGFHGATPQSWARDGVGWHGLLPPERNPRRIDPSGGLLWSANNRLLEGSDLEIVGDGGYAFGARAKQIREALGEMNQPGESDQLALQLDDRAVFLGRWRKRILQALEQEVEPSARYRALRALLSSGWSGRADVESTAYRFVREIRRRAAERALGPLAAPARKTDPEFDYFLVTRQWERPLWRLLTEQPAHLLDSAYRDWNELLLRATDDVLASVDGELDAYRWGARNRLRMRHPLSLALPAFGGLLNMPPDPLPGDVDMPRVQTPSHGAAVRFVVSPGQEDEGLFEAPGGPSGHPLSPFYRSGHKAWVRGEPTPLQTGPIRYLLELEPAG